jgi:hypothetical protein
MPSDPDTSSVTPLPKGIETQTRGCPKGARA